MRDKLTQLQTRFDELERLLSDESVISDIQKLKETSQEYDDLKEIIAVKKKLEKIETDLAGVEKMLAENSDDAEMAKITAEEKNELLKNKNDLEKLLAELSAYAEEHLKTEEKYFALYDYPQKEAHAKTHDTYREKIRDFMAAEQDHFASFEIMDFLEDWWLGHVITMDKAYEPFFKEKIKP